MSKIKKIKGRQVFDSRGNPTVEAEVFLKDGHFASTIVPSGASTGTYEAFELRDRNNKNYLGKSVLKAVENINGPIKKALNNIDINDQKKIDKTLLDLDGTEQKKKLGANAILAVSIASCKLAAIENNTPLYKYLGNSKSYQLPIPLLNIINGGVHAKNNLDIQEFMIRPEKIKSFSEAIRRSFLVIQNLKGMINNTNVGDEGGFAPNLTNNEEAIELIIKAIEKSGFKPGEEVSICLDVAANELNEKKTIDYYYELTKKYPIKSIEDPFTEDDWKSWKKITKETNIQIVGDDLFATNISRLQKGIKEKAANAILIKPNQIGTVTETLEVIKFAQKNKFKTIVSHRSGDSEDTFIADLAVGTRSNQIKTGSLSRSERVAKYNRLLRIEEELGKHVKMANI
ncbi:MAG: phosphopyruvate hydratase [Pelagibacteraceae bacterium]|jgi:enolase|nr:phosphopyruvate hydratase [Pelagibacteraceae bacterium]|tara:strand:- start:9584 stop:10783 length:1200 start_codon:yes stop_codon:yes gene_type:complete